MSSTIKVTAVSNIQAEFSVPGDKSLSHRVAIIGGLAKGSTAVRNFLPSEDCLNTLNAMKGLGVSVDVQEEMVGFGPVAMMIHGKAGELTAPSGPIDCGNSGTGMRLLAGLLSGQAFTSELFGDESLSGRPMNRIIKPLELMGAKITACGEKPGCAPLEITGDQVRPIHYDMPMASAQVKSAVMLAGMFAEGTTSVTQPATTRDHSERLLRAFGVAVKTEGNTISLVGGQTPEAIDFLVPGDISSAAFWLVAAAALPGASIKITDVGLNPTRTAIIDVLKRMGAGITVTVTSGEGGEPIGDVHVIGAELKGTEILESEVANLIDEVPIIAVAGALASGRTSIRNAAELRVKETDRIATVADNLRAMGAEVTEFEDGMEIEGGRPLTGTTVKSFGDHRIAMSFAIAGLFAAGETVVEGCDCINTSYPGFARVLELICQGKGTPTELAPEITSH